MGFVIAVFLLIAIFCEMVQDESINLAVAAISFPFGLYFVTVQIRRWHDLNKNGMWVLINIISIIGPIWATIETGFIRGTVGSNKYGEDPLESRNIPKPNS